jgi:hypothetical protein
MNPQAWTEAAACRSVGGDIWFPEPGDLTWLQARSICGTCPVLALCRDWIMTFELGKDYRYRFGITAAMSPLQRHRFEPQWLAEQIDGAA